MKKLNLKQRKQNKPSQAQRAFKPFRCLCGSMLARLVPGGIELKCRRCKRQVIVPLEEHRAVKMIHEI
jgi:phage FluMu protein Com